MSSTVVVYPCTYAEGLSISTMEYLALAAIPVTSTYGALETSIGKDRVLVEDSPGSHSYESLFTDSVVHSLTDDQHRSSLACRGRQRALTLHSWDTVADAFEAAVTTAYGLPKTE